MTFFKGSEVSPPFSKKLSGKISFVRVPLSHQGRSLSFKKLLSRRVFAGKPVGRKTLSIHGGGANSPDTSGRKKI